MFTVEYKRDDIRSGKLHLNRYETRDQAQAAAAFLEKTDDHAVSIRVVEITARAAIRAAKGE